MSDTETLAKELGVSLADLNCLALSVCNDLIKDKADAAYLVMDEEMQEKMTAAYLSAAIKKFELFYCNYLTNKRFKDSFAGFVYTELKDVTTHRQDLIPNEQEEV